MKNDEAYDIYFQKRTPRDTIAAGLRDYQRDWGEMDPPFDRLWWTKAGAKYPSLNRPWTKFDDMDLVSMVDRGMSNREIAAVLRRTTMSVEKRIRRRKDEGSWPSGLSARQPFGVR